MQIGKYKYEFDFFSWIKKTELVELDSVNPEDDPVRPELNNDFRTTKGRIATKSFNTFKNGCGKV